MITPRPYEQKIQQQQLNTRGGYASSASAAADQQHQQLPFPPPVPPPPLPPSAVIGGGAAGGWGGHSSNYYSDSNNQQSHAYVPGGTWQHAAIYSGAFGNGYLQQQQQQSAGGGDQQQLNETVPIEHQVPSYIANKETFPHQKNAARSSSSTSRDRGPQQQHQTASGLEVHAMQRLVNSAKTRFGPSAVPHQYQDPNQDISAVGNNNNNFYQPGQDYFEKSNQQNQVLVAESHARREKLLNSHRNSGGVAYEEKLRRHREKLMQSGRGPVTTIINQSVTGLDGTFRRTSTPQPSSTSTTSHHHGKYPMPTGKFSIGGAGNKKLGTSSAIPLSQAQTSMLVSGIRPSATSGLTTKSKLKGEAPDLKKSLAEGFGMRFQPEQIEQMHLPDSVAEAALEVSRYYRSTGGGYDNGKRQNPAAPETSYIHGVGDMFQKMKGQYLQMQKMAVNNSSGTSPVPKNPRQQAGGQQLFKKYHPHGDDNDAGSSPLRAAQRHVGLQNSTRNTNNNSTTTPLYSIAGTGAYRESDQIISSPTAVRGAKTTTIGNNTSASSPSSPNNSHHRQVQFEAPKPSARALALRAELENLEKQWKDLHEGGGGGSTNISQHHNTSTMSMTPAAGAATTLSPEPQAPPTSTRDQVLGRINAVLR